MNQHFKYSRGAQDNQRLVDMLADLIGDNSVSLEGNNDLKDAIVKLIQETSPGPEPTPGGSMLSTYLTFEAPENLSDSIPIYFTALYMGEEAGGEVLEESIRTIEVSTDNGLTWTQMTPEFYEGEPRNYADVCIGELSQGGQKILVRGDNSGYVDPDNYVCHNFQVGAYDDCYVYGNIMSLIDSENFAELTEITEPIAFAYLFASDFDLPGVNPVKDESTRLVLPATELSMGCYSQMFYCDRAITESPVLPAEYIPMTAYAAMFWGCSSLEKITCLATDGDDICTGDWVENVAASGVFVKSPDEDGFWSALANIEAEYGIPVGWTVQNYGEEPTPTPSDGGFILCLPNLMDALDGNSYATFESISAAALALGVSSDYLEDALYNKIPFALSYDVEVRDKTISFLSKSWDCVLDRPSTAAPTLVFIAEDTTRIFIAVNPFDGSVSIEVTEGGGSDPIL